MRENVYLRGECFDGKKDKMLQGEKGITVASGRL